MKKEKKAGTDRLRSSRLLDPAWEGADPLRETVLSTLPQEDGALLRQLLTRLVSLSWEVKRDPGLSFRGSYTKADLLAASNDLRFVARSLALLAEVSVGDPTSSPGEIELGRFADRLALAVEALAERTTAEVLAAEIEVPA